MKVQRKDLKNAGGDAIEVDESLDGIGRIRDQAPISLTPVRCV